MRAEILTDMLLINEPSAISLYRQMMNIASVYLAPCFTLALVLEYFGQMDFGSVVKKLFIVTIALSVFYQIHTEGVKIAFEGASSTIQKVNPNNLFVKKWYHSKMATRENKSWNFLEAFAIPNLNDLVATAFFVISKIFIWILKLIYTTVYHLTYIFAPITAILYFFGWTNNSLKGSVQASLWCMLMPFVVVTILVLVGNSMDQSAKNSELVIAHIDTIVWLFGVTLLLLLTPIITLGLVSGSGVHTLGTKMGVMMIGAGLKAGMVLSSVKEIGRSTGRGLSSVSNSVKGMKEKFSGKSDKESSTTKLQASDDQKSQKESSKDSQTQSSNNNATETKNQKSSQTQERQSSNNNTAKESHSNNRQSKESVSSVRSDREQRKLEQNQNFKNQKEASTTPQSSKTNSVSQRSSNQITQRSVQNSNTQSTKQTERIIRKERPNELRGI